MNLAKTIILNRMVMTLISKKYPENIGPGGFTNPDGKYYQKLDQENELAIRVLGRKAPTVSEIATYTTWLRSIVAALEKNGNHKFKRSPNKVS